MIADILKTKLEAIDAYCEGAVRTEVNRLHAEARYDGYRFRVPSFEDAEKLWLNLIVEKEREFIREIGRVLSTPGAVLGKKDAATIKEAIDNFFSEDRYIERLRLFSEGVARTARSYGLVFNAQDISEAAYRAGAMNALRRARKNVIAELELHGQTNAPDFVRYASQCWHYFWKYPSRFLGALAVAALIWFFTNIGFAEMWQWLRNVGEEGLRLLAIVINES
jgi:hypothetical protein